MKLSEKSFFCLDLNRNQKMIHTSSFHHAKYVWMTLRIIEIHLWIIAQKTSFHRSIDWFWNSFSFGIAAHLHHHSRLSYYPFPHFLRASIIVYSWCMNYLDGSSTDFKSLHANDFWAHSSELLMPRRGIDLQCWLFFQTLQWAKSNTEMKNNFSFELISTPWHQEQQQKNLCLSFETLKLKKSNN